MPDDELMTPREAAYLEAKEGPVYVAWEIFERWVRRWREDHPDDPRCELALLMDVYGNEALAN